MPGFPKGLLGTGGAVYRITGTPEPGMALLTNLSYGNPTPDAHTHTVSDLTDSSTIVLLTGNQTITGIKTFGSLQVAGPSGNTLIDSAAATNQTADFPNASGIVAIVQSTSTTATQAVFATTTAGELQIRAITYPDISGMASTDIVINNSAKGVVLKDTAGTPHYWRIVVSTLGVLSATDLGTSPP